MKLTQIKHLIFRKSTLLIGMAVIAAGIVFIASWLDPMVNYYGVHMRQSELLSLVKNNPPNQPDFALYCISVAPFSFTEVQMCFDSSEELERVNTRRTEIQQQIEHGN
jgi:hypothetical protein